MSMPRRARLLLSNVPLHIIQRGNNRSPCFFADEDRAFFLEHLQRLARKHEVAIHAYVLMTNHVHLLVSPRCGYGASALMKHLGQRYVQYINRIYRRSGSLWEGRFRSSLVDAESYLLLCQRYIELNPVRACMVQHPADYAWSSFPSNALGRPSALLSPHPVYLGLGADAAARQHSYRELFRHELDPGLIDQIRTTANGGFALGNDRFRDEIATILGRRVAPAKRGPRPQAFAAENQTDIRFD